jgi:hypothetical protein
MSTLTGPQGIAVNEIHYFLGKRWTTLEIVLWLSALLVCVPLGLLAVTGVIGHWATLLAPLAGLGVALMRYRAEKREKVDPRRE